MTIKEISVTRANELLQDTNDYELVDVRREDEYGEVHAERAVNIPLDQLENCLDELPKDRQLLMICRSGGRSMQAAQWLADHGIDEGRLYNVTGGTLAWQEAGLPTVSPAKLEE